jgi:hypothetical protein
VPALRRRCVSASKSSAYAAKLRYWSRFGAAFEKRDQTTVSWCRLSHWLGRNAGVASGDKIASSSCQNERNGRFSPVL